jgi:hypothetical protein
MAEHTTAKLARALSAIPAPANSYEYMLLHKRVYRARGKASAHECSGCPARARDWARVHTESGHDPWADYVPLCRACHIRYDETGRAVAVSNNRRRELQIRASHREAIGAAHLGKTVSAETRAKLSASLKGRPQRVPTAPAVAAEIKRRYAEGRETMAVLAREFGVSAMTVGRIVNGRRTSA